MLTGMVLFLLPCGVKVWKCGEGVEMEEFVGYIRGLHIVYDYKNVLKCPKKTVQNT